MEKEKIIGNDEVIITEWDWLSKLFNNYRTEKGFLVIKPKEKLENCDVAIFFDKKGRFRYMELTKNQQTKPLICWEKEVEVRSYQRIVDGKTCFSVVKTFLTTSTSRINLMQVKFTSMIAGEKEEEIFSFDRAFSMWCSIGNISKKHRNFWIALKQL